MTSRIPVSLFAALLLSLLCGAIASAEGEPTRGEYVTQLEGLCKPGAEATERAVAGVRADLNAERLKPAAAKFAKSASILGSTLATIKPVPRPSADASKLAKWMGYIRQEKSFLEKAAAALQAGNRASFQRYSARFVHNGNLANRTVLAFGFDYCGFKPSRFG